MSICTVIAPSILCVLVLIIALSFLVENEAIATLTRGLTIHKHHDGVKLAEGNSEANYMSVKAMDNTMNETQTQKSTVESLNTTSFGSARAESNDPNASACMPHCRAPDQSIEALTHVLQSSPQQFALNPVRTEQYCFPGLDDNMLANVFQGRKTVLVGDSTLYYATKWLHAIMHRLDQGSLGIPKNTTLSQANRIIDPTNALMNLHAQQNPSPYITSDTHIEWLGFVGSAGALSCEFNQIWERVALIRPSIMVVNMGLHWLHFNGRGRDVAGCVTERWIRYEDFLDEAVKSAQNGGVQILLFKTTNFICSNKYGGQYKKADDLYSTRDENTMKSCKNVTRTVLSDRNVTDEDIEDYCENGAFNDAGASFLNSRLQRFVHSKRGSVANMTLAVFNDHDVESCEYTELLDGRHYRPLNLLRIRLLGNILSCLLDIEPQKGT